MITNAKLPLTVTFAEHGGYDAMTCAYDIKDASGVTLLTIDTKNYDRGDELDYEGNWELAHSECLEARLDAEFVAESLTEKLVWRAPNCHQG